MQGQQVPAAQAMVGALGLGTPHWHLTGKEQSTANLGGSRGTQLQGVTAPAPATCHKGKLRHDGFKHTSTGPAWPCALPSTITRVIPRGTVPSSTVHGGAASKRCSTQRHDIRRSTTPESTITKGMTPKTQYDTHDTQRHNIQRGMISGGTRLRRHNTQDAQYLEVQYPEEKCLKRRYADSRCTRMHNTQGITVPKGMIFQSTIPQDTKYPERYNTQ